MPREVSGRFSWLLYGAYGHTGQLITREALRRGHRPTLAGRDRERLSSLAESSNLPWVHLSLSDPNQLAAIVQRYDLVVNAAGPFKFTARQMAKACIAGRTNYVDVAGELSVFSDLYSLDEEASDAGIALIPGCGFDIVPTDSLAAYLAESMPDATLLELALDTESHISAGTAKAAAEVVAEGGYILEDGVLTPHKIGDSGPNVRFHKAERKTMLAPLADLASSYRTTGIENIRTYISLPPGMGKAGSFAPAISKLMSMSPIRRLVKGAIDLALKSSDSSAGSASIWGRVSNENQEWREAWIRTPEPYHYTARTVVNAVEGLKLKRLAGALTPAQAFGIDFALNVPGTERFDYIPI